MRSAEVIVSYFRQNIKRLCAKKQRSSRAIPAAPHDKADIIYIYRHTGTVMICGLPLRILLQGRQ